MLIKVTHGSGPRFDEDSPECVLDVAYECDTSGKYPSPGDAAAQLRLTEVQVPRARVQSREPGSEVFVGAAVRVTKIVQRTFEFVNGAAAAEALVTMLMHTQGTDAHSFAREKIMLRQVDEDDEEEGGSSEEEDEKEDGNGNAKEGGRGGGGGDGASANIRSGEGEKSNGGERTSSFTDSLQSSTIADKTLDSLFGLLHGGCRFQASRPLTVALAGISDEHGEVMKETERGQ
jgi:hypothetical protein